MGKKGFAISAMLYTILLVFLAFIAMMLYNIQSRKTILDVLKASIKESIDNNISDKGIVKPSFESKLYISSYDDSNIQSLSEITSTSETNGYAYKQTIKITYTAEGDRYFMSDRAGTTTSDAVHDECGNDRDPVSVCNTYKTPITNIEANTWYKLSDDDITITYDKDSSNVGKLQAYIVTEVGGSISSEATIEKIDRTAPNVPTPTFTGYKDAFEISINRINDSESGFNYINCEFNGNYGYKSDPRNITNGSNSCLLIDSNITYPLTATLYVYDRVGNRADFPKLIQNRPSTAYTE